jgi:tetrahydromethanopterin S-methyltransferase subunit G
VLSKIRGVSGKKKGRKRGLLYGLSVDYFFTRSWY